MKNKLSFVLLVALAFAALPLVSASGYVAVSVGIAPPAIPVYTQPLCPAPGYIWTPGYWSYGPFGYYWVPGEWVAPPAVGLLWTPGFWGYNGGRYVFHEGYWGRTVGFYGGINYGYGYIGHGYYGGEWVGNTFRYNTAVSRVNTTVIPNTYVNKTVLRNAGSRAGFNGPGGAQAKPTAQERAAANVEHVAPTSAQRQRVAAARNDPALRASNNKGKPKAAAVRATGQNGGQRAAAAAPRNASGEAARAPQRRAKAAQATERARPAANTARSQQANHARRAAQVRRPVQRTSAAVNRRPAQHAVAGPRRPQTIQRRQGPPANHAPAPGAQNAKKKKKQKEKPGGG